MKPRSAACRAEGVAIDAPRLYTAAAIAASERLPDASRGVTMNEPVSVAVRTRAGYWRVPDAGSARRAIIQQAPVQTRRRVAADNRPGQAVARSPARRDHLEIVAEQPPKRGVGLNVAPKCRQVRCGNNLDEGRDDAGGRRSAALEFLVPLEVLRLAFLRFHDRVRAHRARQPDVRAQLRGQRTAQIGGGRCEGPPVRFNRARVPLGGDQDRGGETQEHDQRADQSRANTSGRLVCARGERRRQRAVGCYFLVLSDVWRIKPPCAH